MKTKFLIVRHGESVTNIQGVYCGQTDKPLTEKGMMQAEITARYLKDEKVDLIYSSDLLRAYQTACAAAAYHNGVDVIKDKRLREIHGGEWEMKHIDKIAADYPDVYKIWLESMEKAVLPGGESVADVQSRIYQCLSETARENPGKTICVFTHGAAIRAFCGMISGTGQVFDSNLPVAANASVTSVEYENGNFTLIEYAYDGHQTAVACKAGNKKRM